MFSRSILRGFASDLRCATSTISSTAPLPQRACLHQAALLQTSQPASETQSSSQPPKAPLSAQPRAQSSTPPFQKGPRVPTDNDTNPVPTRRCDVPIEKQPVKQEFTKPLEVSKSLMEQLPHLCGQGPHYVVAQLHARPYLLTEGDNLRLPFLMPGVKSGDILRFNRASALGSRDYTLKGSPTLDERLYTCRVRVTGVESEPMRIKEKTKRRRRHVQGIRSKHRYTTMRVMEVSVHSPDKLLGDGAVVVEDSTETVIEKAAPQ